MTNYKFGMTDIVYKSIMGCNKKQLLERSCLLQKEIDSGILKGIGYSKELELINATINQL